MIQPITYYSFEVDSHTQKDKKHTVTYDLTDKKSPVVACSCEAFEYKKSEDYQCKHILEVKMYLQNKPTDVYFILGQLKAAITHSNLEHANEYFFDLQRILQKKEILRKLYS